MSAALLIFSPKCPKCTSLLNYIAEDPQLRQIVTLHNVNTHGIPRQYASHIKSVPTLLTSTNKIIIGAGDIKNFLDSLFPTVITQCELGTSFCYSLTGDNTNGSLFDLNHYGKSLQPALTPELVAKCNQKVQ